MTDKQRVDILHNMVVVTDSREQKNDHIKNYLTKKGIKFIIEKLEVGDYSCVFPNYPELELDYKFTIERKNSLSEIAGNFTKNRERFIREFERLKDGQKIHLLIETATWRKVFNSSYRSNFNPDAFKASLLTFCIRYNMPIWFCEKSESPELIYKILYYETYNYLKGIK